jgi:O-antigen/teichoic acid export membrane protein
MASLKINFISNLLGSVITAIIQVAVMPIYLRHLGVDGFGLIGFFATLAGVAFIFDMGLTPAITRELASASVTEEKNNSRTILRTLETIYFSFAILCFIPIFFSVPFLATYWLKIQNLSISVVEQSLQLMVVQLFFQLPVSFYTGAFIGLQRQPLLNIINTSMISIRLVGVIPFIIIKEGSVLVFFGWQALITFIHLLVIFFFLRYIIPNGKSKFDISVFYKVKKYAYDMLGVTIVSLILTNLDKIVLSYLLSLEEFGFYMLAWSIASILVRPAGIVMNVWLPKMVQQFTLNDTLSLSKTYLSGSRLVACLVIPFSAMLVFFPSEFLLLYLGENNYPDSLSYVLAMLSIGSACNALMHIPYALTLAASWPKFALYQNIIACFILLPLAIFSVIIYGFVAGGVSWLLINLGCILFSVYAIHKKILMGTAKNWYIKTLFPDFILMLIIISFPFFLCQLGYFPTSRSALGSVLFLVCFFLVSFSWFFGGKYIKNNFSLT